MAAEPSIPQILLLALIQGLTEFLPVSSSAHLILPAALFGLPDQGLAFDVAAHLGSLAAVLVHFRSELAAMAGALVGRAGAGEAFQQRRLFACLVLATVPAGLAALALGELVEARLRSVAVIAATTLFFGILLGAADRLGGRRRRLDTLGLRDALLIGAAQALALVPGTSRSGITITAALFLGFEREAAARFSFLLAIPVIALSGLYEVRELLASPAPPWGQLALAAGASALAAWLAIGCFLKWVERVGMMPFVWYRILLGVLLAGLAAGGVV
ncbi:MAG: undecaprenyl-diphosphatase [Porticoccaceae bacterium]|nr:MAG: undecaprenyl-diphosphatase [Porticoccaceae bacterium]